MIDRDPGAISRLTVAHDEIIGITVDGCTFPARVGETVLTALRMERGHVRSFEFSSEKRAGFCLMSACQDCWLWHQDGRRLRACTTRAENGMKLVTLPPEHC